MLVADWVVRCGSFAVAGVADMLVDVAVCCGCVCDGGVAFAACVIEPVFGVEAFVGGIAFVVLLMLVFVARVTVVVAGVAEVVAGVAASCVVVWMSSWLLVYRQLLLMYRWCNFGRCWGCCLRL